MSQASDILSSYADRSEMEVSVGSSLRSTPDFLENMEVFLGALSQFYIMIVLDTSLIGVQYYRQQ